MPVTKVKTPDGNILKINHPEGASKEQIFRFAKSRFTSKQPTIKEATPSQPQAQSDVLIPKPFTQEEFQADVEASKQRKLREKAGQRITDPIPFVGGLVRGAEKVGEAGTQILGRGIDALAGLGGVDTGLTKNIEAQQVEREKQFQKRKGEFSGLGEFVGGAAAGGGVSKGGKAVISGLKSLGVGVPIATATTPVEEKGLSGRDFLLQKAQQAGLSAATMGLLQGGVKGLQAAQNTALGRGVKSASDRARVLLGGEVDDKIVTKNVSKVFPDSRQIKDKSKVLYDRSRESGEFIPDEDVVKQFDKVINRIPTDPVERRNFEKGRAQEAVDEMFDLASAGKMTLPAADTIDKQLTLRANEAFSAKDEASHKLIKDIQSDFRDFITQKGGAFKDNQNAVKLWAQAKKLEEIEAIIENAAGRDNPVPIMQNSLRALLKNRKRARKFSKEERALIREASRSKFVVDKLKRVGSRLVGIGGIVTGSPSQALAFETASTVSRDAAERLQTKEVQDIARLISTGQRPVRQVTSVPELAIQTQTAREISQDVLQPFGETIEDREALIKRIQDRRASGVTGSQEREDLIRSIQQRRNPKKTTGFKNVIDDIFQEEGGFVADDGNTGSPAKFGINQKANPDIDVKNLTKEKAEKLYKTRYWNKIKADSLSPDMQVAAMDSAVNQGVNWTNKALKKANGNLDKFIELRRKRYKNTARNPRKREFLDAWLNRLDRVSQKAREARG